MYGNFQHIHAKIKYVGKIDISPIFMLALEKNGGKNNGRDS